MKKFLFACSSFGKNLCIPCKNPTTKEDLFEEEMLPSEIVEDILLRLPVQPLLRFRCVCKSWCALISDPHFINHHLVRSTESNEHIVLEGCRAGFSSNGEVYMLPNANWPIVKLNYPSVISISGSSSDRILSYCNGLICIWDENDTICLWNPFTRKHKILPPLSSTTSTKKKKNHYGLGLGYNSVSKDHEVVRVREAEIEVYSLGGNSWTRIGNFPYRIYYQSKGAAFLGASLHWLGTRDSNTEVQPNCIISFNMVSRKLRIFDLPGYECQNVEWTTNLACWTNISESDGCLSVLRDHCNRMEVWVMKKYGVTESWVKVFTSEELRLPLCITKTGDFIMKRARCKSLCVYDPIRKSSWNLAWEGYSVPFRTGTVFTESLIQL